MSDLDCADLSVGYGGTVAVRPLDLHVAGGRLLSVTGPSGAGKSSLLWALARALRPAAATVTGTVRVDGWTTSWTGSGSASSAGTSSTGSRAGSSSAWRSPVPSPCSRGCSSRKSRRATSTRATASG